MKIYPKIEQNEREKQLSELTTAERIQRYLALALAFVSVFIFLVKLLFL